MLTSDAEVHSDGGGRVSAARVVIAGPDKVARFLTGIFRKRWFQQTELTSVNGEPGLVFRSDQQVVSVMSFRIEDGIKAVYIMVNPDKLGRWSITEVN